VKLGIADAISRASLEAVNLCALAFCVAADLGANRSGGLRYTFGRRRMHVLATLVICVVVAVNTLLNSVEVLDDLSWLADKESLWEKKGVNAMQLFVGLGGMAASRQTSRSRAYRADSINHKGVHLHAISTSLDALFTLIVSFLTPNRHRASLFFNVLATLSSGAIVLVYSLPVFRSVLRILLQIIPAEDRASLDKRIAQLATVPGVRDCQNVHFWIESEGIHVCTMQARIAPDADSQAVLAAAFELFDDLLDDWTLQIDRDEV